MPKAMTRAMSLAFAKVAHKRLRDSYLRKGLDPQTIRSIDIEAYVESLKDAYAEAERAELKKIGDEALAGRQEAIGR